ncbi:MAG: glutamate formimidoyltransferase [Chlorobi bacterium]|nr:glutamate formimidoyltransferase [Chlorobiota bacterium]
MAKKLLECVPNISEGRDPEKIKEIARQVETVEGVKLLDVDPGKATNRTVITFVGEPDKVVEAAFRLIKKAKELIDMRAHKGEHPRFGATDVCPLVPVSGMTMEEAAEYARKLGKRVGEELNIPVYLYEYAATEEKRRNLANVRSGEYEGLKDKLADPEWKPDFGPSEWNEEVARSGAVAIGARDFLVAYNVNLNTTSTRRANAIAFDIREAGRVKRKGHPLTGEIVRDKDGKPVRIPGKFKGVKGIGWYIDEYGIAQVSYNITDIRKAPVHLVFDETVKAADKRGVRVTGSEIVGLVPKKVLLDAADYFLRKQQRSLGIPEKEKIKIAVKSLGLDDLKPFDPKEKVIEYKLQESDEKKLIDLSLEEFADLTASERPAPGGGSVAAYTGALGAALGTMVANLSSHKRGWDEKWEYYSDWAVRGENLKRRLLELVDADTRAFDRIMAAFRLPKNTDEEREARRKAIEEATVGAIEVPLEVMRTALEALEVNEAMLREGLPTSYSDALVGVSALESAAEGAYYNVLINAAGLEDREKAAALTDEATRLRSRMREKADRLREEGVQKLYKQAIQGQ